MVDFLQTVYPLPALEKESRTMPARLWLSAPCLSAEKGHILAATGHIFAATNDMIAKLLWHSWQVPAESDGACYAHGSYLFLGSHLPVPVLGQACPLN
jgi:hypothetical protein